MELKRMRLRRNGSDLPLPREIMMEILHRLPLKSLLTCKRVSKQWKEVITDPMFYKRHTNYSDGPAFIMGPEIDALSGLFISEEGFELHRIPIGLKKRVKYPNGPTSCNGIVGVLTHNAHFLFHNLFTGGSFAVRNSPGFPYWNCLGFGYDSQADDYKILVVCDHPHNPDDEEVVFDGSRVQNAEKSLFWVYSFHNKGWEQFDGFPATAAACNRFRSHQT